MTRWYDVEISVSKYLMSNYNDVVTMREMLDDTLASWARERPDLELGAMGTVLRMGQLMNAAIKAIDGVFEPYGVTLGEFDVLAALRRGGDGTLLTPGALARVAMVSPAGMTNRLNRLEAAGLITRGPDPGDRRGSLVGLTERGRDIADRAVGDLVAAENEIFAALGAAEHEHFDSVLDKLIAGLEATR
jgi:DNA-binding MarR family transcriptional regulator